MEFQCRLGTATGEILEGNYAAESETRLRHDLERRGLHVLAVKRRGGLGLASWTLPRRRRIGTREFLVFNQELATLLRAGMPLVQSLDILRSRVDHPVFKPILDDVHERVRGGAALSEAFEAQGELFPGVYTASLLAGEKSGGLEQVLLRYVGYQRVIGAIRRKTISALVYPAILLALSLAVVAIIVLRVVPEFAGFYAGFGAQLPIATRAIVATSLILRSYFAVLALVALAVIGAGWFWIVRGAGRATLDRAVLRVPWLGSVAGRFATSQLARTLATLLNGGIPLVNALDASARAMGNRHLTRELETVAQRVREGEGLAPSLAARGVFPDVAIRMVEVGESTGALAEMLNSLADFFDEEIETTLGRFITLVEPVLLVTMGIVIAALLLALYMPLLQLSSVLGS